MKQVVIALTVSGLLGGCGAAGIANSIDSNSGDNGGSGGSATTTAEGLWRGTTDTNRSVTGVVLHDGTFYVLYSAAGNPSVIAGVVQGSGTSNNGSLSSSNAKDFNLEGHVVYPVTVSASYYVKQSLNGQVTSVNPPSGTVSFTSTYDSSYEVTPTISALVGTYLGQVATSGGVESVTLTVNSSGVISGTGASGCAASGTVATRSDGNIYDFSIAFGGAPCQLANQTLIGIAYYNSITHFLYGAAPNASRTDGVLFVGSKQ